MPLNEAIATYLAHTAAGVPLRVLAREKNVHASTVLRQIRRIEARRDDPLFDEALDTAEPAFARVANTSQKPGEFPTMNVKSLPKGDDTSEPQVEREARRILRRLCEKNAFLVVAPDMEKAVVLREVTPGRHNRIAVLDRDVARAFALREWIACDQAGRVARYSITSVGRSALRRLLDAERARRGESAAAQTYANPFREQHQMNEVRDIGGGSAGGTRRVRYNLAESPLTVLGRKRTSCGKPYLSAELVQAGESLREDFEISQLGPKVGQNWDRFLSASDKTTWHGGGEPSSGAMRARDRLSDALAAMGPGLSDIAFRVCCFLEGLETAEKRLGWSARSGKVVLRIALERLSQHYGLGAGDERIERRRSA